MYASYTGEKISALRREKGLTQKELAERLNVTNKAVSKWERGKNFPDLTLLPPLADALGTTVSELLGVEQPIAEETIAVLSAVSQQEKRSIKRSLFQFILLAMLASLLYILLRFNAEGYPDRCLLILNVVVLVNGGAVLDYLHRKLNAPGSFRWPLSQEELWLNNFKISVSLWGDKLRRK